MFVVEVIMAFVVAATCPSKFTITVLHVLVILALVGVGDVFAAGLFPDTFAFFHALHENAAVRVAVGPPILPVPICTPIGVLAEVHVTIGELV